MLQYKKGVVEGAAAGRRACKTERAVQNDPGEQKALSFYFPDPVERATRRTKEERARS